LKNIAEKDDTYNKPGLSKFKHKQAFGIAVR